MQAEGACCLFALLALACNAVPASRAEGAGGPRLPSTSAPTARSAVCPACHHQQVGKIPEPELAAITARILPALAYMHSHRMVSGVEGGRGVCL